ncbi:CYTH domain-containing protein [Phyllobacterium sp. BT25]|uniref:CYTH domain-containing protein n=1 Tax=Phyllobacterium pellucidum TaxID=2740464 RepID=A0A849VUB9_9HYPH|nr:CYTH domain-containing protein [Phyllobacterium pellucidum]NTS33276.1 CYTH domain-containing protein [Phyllobacterium pellucidum]
MAIEIERKYLVKDKRWRKYASNGSTLRQAYLLAAAQRSVRVRTIDDLRATLTVKVRLGPLRREEFQYEIPYADALQIFRHCVGVVVEKTRHEVVDAGQRWEIDVYHGIHQGLTVAEIELQSESDLFPRPVWLGIEITGEFRYSNQVLAMARLAPGQSGRETIS